MSADNAESYFGTTATSRELRAQAARVLSAATGYDDPRRPGLVAAATLIVERANELDAAAERGSAAGVTP